MRLPLGFLTVLAISLSGAAAAQQGSLAGVTMRVLDDLADVDAVILELDPSRGESDDGGSRAAEASRERERAAESADEGGGEARREQRREPDELHDAERDERSEGRLEDRDIERPAEPLAEPPA